MRILLVGDSIGLQDNLEGYSQRALERLGHTVLLFDCLTTRLSPVKAIPVAWRQRLRRWFPAPRQLGFGLRRREISATNDELIRLIERTQPALVLVFKGVPFTASTLRTITDRFHIPLVNWCPDDPFRFLSDEVYPGYDLFCVANPTCLQPLTQHGARRVLLLRVACEPQVHRTLVMDASEDGRWRSEVCFVGSYHPHRAAVLEAVTRWKLGIWGPGWERLPPSSALRPHVRGPALRVHEWVKAYNAASLVLNVSHPQERDVALPMRPFEALGCGAALLTSWSEDGLSLFQLGRELDMFRHPEELASQVAYYLSHVEERLQMARCGQAKVYAEHTYAHRMQELLQAIQPLMRQKR